MARDTMQSFVHDTARRIESLTTCRLDVDLDGFIGKPCSRRW
jgi:hypothetical protein